MTSTSDAARAPRGGDRPARAPQRVRQPTDLVRLALDVVAVGAVLALGSLAPRTTSGLDVDLRQAARNVPAVLVWLAAVTATLAALALPLAILADLVARRQAGRILDTVTAAIAGVLASLGLNAWLPYLGRDTGLLSALTGGNRAAAPTVTYLVAIVAGATVANLSGRRWARVTVWGGVLAAVLTGLLGTSTTALAILLTLLLGHTVGVAVRYLFGRYSQRPSPRAIVDALRRADVDVMSLRPAPHRDGRSGEGPRRFLAVGHDRSRVDVTVLDRDRQGAGWPYQLWRALIVRRSVRLRPMLSVRRAAEHEALLTLAAAQAGARVPRLVVVTDVAGESTALVVEHVPGRRFGELPSQEVTDERLRAAWRQVSRLHARRITHRSLTGDAFLLADDGSVYLLELGGGDLAASDLALRLDLAQLLTAFALLVGVARAVSTAVAVLGPGQLAQVLPLLQPIALNRQTRHALRADRQLLPRLREALLTLTSPGSVEPVRLQRVPPRTLITIIASVLALYVLAGQLASANLRLLVEAQWGWALAAVGFSVLSFVGAGVSLLGFSPQPLPFWRTLLVQVAASFVTLVAPASVGTVALNARYLQRRGVRGSLAVASVGLSQLTTFVVHVTLLITFGFLTGRQQGGALVPSTGTLLLVTAVVALGGLVLLVPGWRRAILDRLRPTLGQVVPRMLDVLQQPKKLALGLVGAALLTLGYVFALEASVLAFGGGIGLASVAVAFLAGAAIGNAAPTPGGVGAVEGALLVTLGALGMPASTALAATLLFRFATFWIRVPVGWVAFTVLQRREEI